MAWLTRELNCGRIESANGPRRANHRSIAVVIGLPSYGHGQGEDRFEAALLGPAFRDDQGRAFDTLFGMYR